MPEVVKSTEQPKAAPPQEPEPEPVGCFSIDELTTLRALLQDASRTLAAASSITVVDRELKKLGFYWQHNNLVRLDHYWDRLHSVAVPKGMKVVLDKNGTPVKVPDVPHAQNM